MAPEELSSNLRRIAAAIDKSKQPSRKLVAKALWEILAKLDPKKYENITDQSVRVDDMLELDDVKATEKIRKAISELEEALKGLEKAA